MIRLAPWATLSLMLSLAWLPASAAADVAPTQIGQADVSRSERLDALFEGLKAAESEEEAMVFERAIWDLWSNPDDPALAGLMDAAFAARNAYDYARAIAILDEIVTRWPDYSEGWNQRATVHFLREDYEASLVDIAETLEREPRHFGALAGRAVIRLRQGKAALAYQNILAAMEFHPYLRERAFFPQLMEPQNTR